MTAAEHLAAAMLELAIESKRALDRAQTASRPHLDLEWSKRCGEAAATILELRDRLPRPAPAASADPAKPSPLSPETPPMTTKITRELQCDLTPTEIEAKRQALAENGLQLVAWEANRKEVLLPIDAEGKHLKTTRKDLAQAIETKRELRPVECIWLEEGTQRKLTRTDTGEVIDQEALSPEAIRQQRQTTLPLEGDAPAPPSPPEAGPLGLLPEYGGEAATLLDEIRQHILTALAAAGEATREAIESAVAEHLGPCSDEFATVFDRMICEGLIWLTGENEYHLKPAPPAQAPRALPAHEATDVEPILPAPDDGVKAAILDRLRSNPGGLLRRDLLHQLLAEVDGADEAQVIRLLGSLLSADLIAYSLETETYFAIARPVGAPPKPAPGEAHKGKKRGKGRKARHGKAAAE